MDKSKELVKQYLKKTMKNYCDDQFSDADLEILARYSVKKKDAKAKY